MENGKQGMMRESRTLDMCVAFFEFMLVETVIYANAAGRHFPMIQDRKICSSWVCAGGDGVEED